MEHTSEHAAHFEEFTQVIRQLTKVVDTLTQIEHQKAQAAAANQHSLIDAYLNPEQAEILKLKGLEQKRIKLGRLLGWEGLTFQQIIGQADSGRKELLSPLFLELDTGINRLTNAMTSAGRVIGVRLRELETAIARENGVTYDSQGMTNHFKDKYV